MVLLDGPDAVVLRLDAGHLELEVRPSSDGVGAKRREHARQERVVGRLVARAGAERAADAGMQRGVRREPIRLRPVPLVERRRLGSVIPRLNRWLRQGGLRAAEEVEDAHGQK